MITIYSEIETTQRDTAGNYLERHNQIVPARLTQEEINQEIQTNLKAFESIDWSKTKDCR